MATGDQPLNLSDFFDPTDKKAVNAFKKELTKVGDKYEKEIGRIVDENERLKKSQKDIIKQAKDLRKELNKNATVADKRRKTIEETNEAAEKLLKTQELEEKQLKDNNKQIVALEGNLKDVGKATKSLNELEKKSLKIKKDEEKLQKVLNKGDEQAVRTKLKLQKASSEQRRELKQLLILEDRQAGTEERLLATNELLRIERKKLNTETDRGVKRQKEINDAIDENNDKLIENSDKLKSNRLQVGSYEDSIKSALEGTDLFNGALGDLGQIGQEVIGTLQSVVVGLKAQEAAQKSTNQQVTKGARALKVLDKAAKATVILALIGIVLALGKAFSASRVAQRNLAIVTSQLGNTLKIVGDRIAFFAVGVFSFIKSGVIGIELLIAKAELAVLKLRDINPLVDITTEVQAAQGQVDILTDKFNKFKKESSEAFGKGAEDFGSVIVETNEQLRIALELQDRLIDLEAVRARELALINGELEKQNAIAGDSTRSFNEQEIAARKVLKIQTERIELELKTANERLDVAAILIRNDLKAAGISASISESSIRNLDILKDKNIADQIQIENLDQLRDASIGLAQIESERAVQAIEAQKQIGEINRDRFEQELDFAIDIFDNQKTINERGIANTEKTFEERFKLLDENKRLNNESFADQIKLSEDVIKLNAKEKLELARQNDVFTKEETKALEDKFKLSQKIDIEALTTLKSQRDIRGALIKQGVADETITLRILEIIKERKTFTEDLAESQRDLLAEFAEFSKTLDRDLKNIEQAFKSEALQIDTGQLERIIELRMQLKTNLCFYLTSYSLYRKFLVRF